MIDGVLKSFNHKKLTYTSATKLLNNRNTDKWMKQRDTTTEAAQMGLPKGVYFGNHLPVKQPLTFKAKAIQKTGFPSADTPLELDTD